MTIQIELTSARACTTLCALCDTMKKASGEVVVEAYEVAKAIALKMSPEWVSCVRSHWSVAKREQRVPVWARNRS